MAILYLASNTKLIIRQGLTSNHPDLDTINYSQFNPTPLKTYVVPIQTGFYVSFNGGFGSISRLALVYTAFSYRGKLYRNWVDGVASSDTESSTTDFSITEIIKLIFICGLCIFIS